MAPPTIVKAFGAASFSLNGPDLDFQAGQPERGHRSEGRCLHDTLPAGLVVATPNGLTGTCGGGTVTADAGSGSVGLANGGPAPPGGSCTITVSVTGATVGAPEKEVNTTSAVERQPTAGPATRRPPRSPSWRCGDMIAKKIPALSTFAPAAAVLAIVVLLSGLRRKPAK